jgi:uncharacterized damage-inducible protein DinB
VADLDPVIPDEKDWTWTLTRRCEDCGLAAGEVDPQEVAARAYVAAEEWVQIVRESPAVEARPGPGVWSPLEYACHVRDVYRVFEERLALVLAEDHPRFENWDQNETAVLARYAEADPERVAEEIEAAAAAFVARARAFGPADLDRRATRSNGSEFTVATLLQYFLHDVVHHLWDVTGQQDGAASLSWE